MVKTNICLTFCGYSVYEEQGRVKLLSTSMKHCSLEVGVVFEDGVRESVFCLFCCKIGLIILILHT